MGGMQPPPKASRGGVRPSPNGPFFLSIFFKKKNKFYLFIFLIDFFFIIIDTYSHLIGAGVTLNEIYQIF
jgi:hypothetical protein